MLRCDEKWLRAESVVGWMIGSGWCVGVVCIWIAGAVGMARGESGAATATATTVPAEVVKKAAAARGPTIPVTSALNRTTAAIGNALFLGDQAASNTTSQNALAWNWTGMGVNPETGDVWTITSYTEDHDIYQVFNRGVYLGSFQGSTFDRSARTSNSICANARYTWYSGSYAKVPGVFRVHKAGDHLFTAAPYLGSVIGSCDDAVIECNKNRCYMTSASGGFAPLVGRKEDILLQSGDQVYLANRNHFSASTVLFALPYPGAAGPEPGRIGHAVTFGTVPVGSFFCATHERKVTGLSCDETNVYVSDGETVKAYNADTMAPVVLPATYPAIRYGVTKFGVDNPPWVEKDRAGNSYTLDSGGNGARIVCTAPDGRVNWQAVNGCIINAADLVSQCGTELRFITPFDEWSYDRATDKQKWLHHTDDSKKYPNDLRHTAGLQFGRPWYRVIDGHRLLYMGRMGGDSLGVFRFDGDTAVSAACFSGGGSTTFPGAPQSQFLWIDPTGAGDPKANAGGFFQPQQVLPLHICGFEVDAHGDIWASHGNIVMRMPLTGFDVHGVPQFAFTFPVTLRGMANSNGGRVLYDTETDTLYLFGATGDTKALGDSGNAYMVGNTMRAYPGFLAGNRTSSFETKLPYGTDYCGSNATAILNTGEPNNYFPNWAKSVALAGRYIFVGYQTGSFILVYDKKTGAYVGNLNAHGPYFADGTYIDTVSGISANTLADGSVVVSCQNEFYANALLFFLK